MVLHLTDRCNNNCTFCMVHRAKEKREDLPVDIIIKHLKAQEPGIRVDLFGGEPTVHPFFWAIVEQIAENGHSLSIASNVRFFAAPGRAKELVELTGSKVYVRTSLYGTTQGSYEETTRSPGSFDQFVAGVKNLVAAGLQVQTNIVLTRRALGEIEKMVRFASELGVARIKFSGLVEADSCPELEPRLKEVRRVLQVAIPQAHSSGLTVTLEKMPICAAVEFISSFSTERNLVGWHRIYEDRGSCGRCLARAVCDGLDPGYVGRNGTKDLQQIESVPDIALKKLPGETADFESIEFLKVHAFPLPEDWQSRSDVIGRCVQTIAAVERRLGRVAFVPESLVEDLTIWSRRREEKNKEVFYANR